MGGRLGLEKGGVQVRPAAAILEIPSPGRLQPIGAHRAQGVGLRGKAAVGAVFEQNPPVAITVGEHDGRRVAAVRLRAVGHLRRLRETIRQNAD